MKDIAVIGAGGWGTSVAKLACENGHNVTLWTHETDVIEEVKSNRTNNQYLPGISLPENLNITNEPSAINDVGYIINCVPTQFIRKVYEENNFNIAGKYVINGSKGIEDSSLLRISQLFSDIIGIDENSFAVFTGPSHAEEVAKHVPTTIVCASENPELPLLVQKIFSNESFRVYASDDVTGCEIGGALKNVIALAAGVIDGLNFGDNTKAALITRGLAEIARLGVALSSKSMTFSGLSGLGDLIVTCNSRHSRNRSFGELIGKGHKVEDIKKMKKTIAEGVATTKSAYELGRKHSVELPITEQMHEIIYKGKDPRQALNDLMKRASKKEWWW